MNVFNKMSNRICCFLFLLIFTRSILSIRITIGAVFENDSSFNKSSQMLQYAIDDANENILGETNLKLAAEIEPIAYGREYAISRKICNLLELGIGAIFGPKSISFAHHAINICDGKEIPYISTHIDADAANKLTVFNIHPSQDSLVLALIDVLNATGWDNVVVLYESPVWLTRIMPVLETNNKVGIRFILRDLDFNTKNDFRPILQQVRDSDIWNIILDCSIEALPVVLKQAMQVGLLTNSYRWIITNLDAHSLDLNQFKYGATNITTFRILNKSHSIFQTEMIDPNNDEIIDDNNFDDSSISNIDLTLNNIIPMYPDKFVSSMGLQESLIYDAVMIYAMTIKQLGSKHIVTMPIYCNDPSTSWDKGYTITNFMKRTKYSGLTGNVEFDNFGVRSSVNIDVLELSESGLETVATWKADGLDKTDRLTINRDRKLAKANAITDDNSLRNKTLKVITTLTDPYTMLKTLSETKSGNDRFEGFAIDLIFELSLLLGFEYEFLLQEDNHYGKCINQATNEWDGMINEVMSGRVDIAITDLTVTAERSKAIHFTPSILNLGIALLYQVPSKAVPKTFSFMAPLSNPIWIMLGVAYISISIVFFILGRISPAQWENPYPCVEEPTHLCNQFSFQSSMWFAAGAILQQGSEIEVKAASIRVASAVWWLFTLIMVSSYTANLAAFLVAENTISLIESVEDFKDCGLDGEVKCKADFGMKQEGSTYDFFKDSTYPTYSHMYQVMKKNDSLFVRNNEEGLRRAQTENYAYLMESTSLVYYTERNCNVTQIGDLIDDRNYAIGMRKGYKYYHALSEGVLILQEKGTLEKLHHKWWKSKRGGGKCQKKETSDADGLDIDHLKGIFVIVTYGSLCALLLGILDALRLIRRRARKAKISFRSELKIELRFLLKSLLNSDKPKPVRFLEDHSQRSESAGTNQTHSVWATSLKNDK